MNHNCKRIISFLLCAMMVLGMIPSIGVSASVFTDIAEQWQVPAKTQIVAEGPQHMQGFAVDLENNHMYWSFTSTLVKTDLAGTKIKEISLPGAHLGDLAFYDGYVYGSYLINGTSGNWDQWNGMFVRKYDTELNLVAEYQFDQLDKWVDAFWAGDKETNPYDVAGIDGVAIGEDPNGEIKLMIAAGIGRVNNLAPYQLIMQCTLDGEYETYYAMETGALPYGCQNLTYNWDTGNYWLGCYNGEYTGQIKERMFEVDIRKDYDDRVIHAWQYSSNEGFEYVGNNMFYTSKNYVNGDKHTGYAMLSVADEALGMVAYKPPKDYHQDSLLYYTMDKGDIATTVPVNGLKLEDQGSMGLDAQVTGATLTAGPDGSENSALKFTTGSRVSVPASNCKVLDSALDDVLTMSLRVKVDPNADYQKSRFMHVASLTDPNGRYVAALEASWGYWVFHIAGVNGTNTAELWVESAGIEADRWYHITVVYSAKDNTTLFYIDGEKVASYTGGAKEMPEIGGLTIGQEPVENAENVGGYEHSTGTFWGDVADFRLYNTALTSDQIASLEKNEDIEAQPLIQYVTDAEHLINGGDAPQPTEPEVTEPEPTEPQPTEPEPTEPEVKLPLGNDDLEMVNVTEADGKYTFKTSSVVTVKEEAFAEMLAALQASGEGTISTWVKVENEQANWYKYLQIVGLQDAEGYPVLALERNWHTLSASTNCDPGNYSSNPKLSTTEWVHLLVTAKDDSVELYLNGEKQPVTGPAVQNIFDNAASFQIGGTANRRQGDSFVAMYGSFENVYVLAEYADADLVSALYNKEDVSERKVVLRFEAPPKLEVENTGSVDAAAVVSEGLTPDSIVDGPKDGIKGLHFTGHEAITINTEAITALNDAISDSMTISAWVKTEGSANAMFEYIAGVADTNGRYIAAFENQWTYHLFHGAEASGKNELEVWPESAAKNTWNLLTGVYDAANSVVDFYIDGKYVGSNQAQYATPESVPEIGYVSIGLEPVAGAEDVSATYGHAAYGFYGDLCDFRIYGSALSAEEVAKIYAGTATAETPLIQLNVADSDVSAAAVVVEAPVCLTAGESTLPLGNDDLEMVNVTEEDGKYKFGTSSVATVKEAAFAEMLAALQASGEGTISTWVKVENEQANWYKFLQIVGLQDAEGYPVLALERNWHIVSASTNCDPGNYSSNPKLSTTEWVHLLVTAKDDSVELYLNGEKQPVAGPAVQNIFDNAASFQIGGTANRRQGDSFAAIYGSFENVYVLAEYADADLVSALYNKEDVTDHNVVLYLNAPEGGDEPEVTEPTEPTDPEVTEPTEPEVTEPEVTEPTGPVVTSVSKILDMSGNGNHGLVVGSFNSCADNKGSAERAVELSNGSSIVLSAEEAAKLVKPLKENSTATISAWVRVDNPNNEGKVHILSLLDEDGYAVLTIERRWGYVVSSTYDAAKNQKYVFNGNSYDKHVKFVAGEWTHVVVTANATSIEVYVNGVKQTGNPINLSSDVFEGVASFQIGGSKLLAPEDGTATALVGAVDDVHIFNTFADQELVDKLYAKPATPDIQLEIPKIEPTKSWIWTADWREQLFQESGMPNNAAQSITLNAARNEAESAQIALRANGDFTIEGVTISDLTCDGNTISAANAEFHYVGYSKLLKNTPALNDVVREAPSWFPEKLLNVDSIEVKNYTTQPIWIRYNIPKDAAAGTYTGTVTVQTDMGDPYVVPVSLTVYDVTLPDPENGTFNLELWGQLVKCFEDVSGNLDVIGKAYGIEAYSDEWWSLMETYAEFMRENRLNSMFINVADLLADAPGTTVNADGSVTYDWSLLDRFVELFLEKGGIKQISAEHLCAQTVTDGAKGFKVEVISGTGADTESTYMDYDYGGKEYLDTYLPQLHAHLEAKGWLDIWHQHIGDEPTIGHMPRHYRSICEQVHTLCPGVTVGDAIGGNNIEEEFDNTMDCWVPTTSAHGENIEFFAQKIAEGDELWLYTAMDPRGDYMNRFIDTQVYKSELLGWLCYKYGATGYLHWGLMEWYVWEEFDPNDNTVGNQNVKFAGDSWCIYPDAENMDIISSIRVDAIREAAEDYELFKLYEQKDAAGAKNLVDSAVRSATNYTTGVNEVASNRLSLLRGAAGSYVATNLFVGKTEEPVKIDGVKNDVLWSMANVESYPMNKTNGTPAMEGDASFLWSEDSLYIAVSYTGQPENLIVYVDGGLTQGAYDAYTAKFVIDPVSKKTTVEGNAAAVATGVVTAGKTTGDTSVMEIEIPWSAVNGLIPKDNDKIGLSVQLVNSNGGIGISAPAAEDASSSAAWAVATLSDYLVSAGMGKPVAYANDIKIDGVIDEQAWQIDKELNTKFYGDCDNEAAFGLLWDENGIYAAFHVKDDVVVNSGAPYCWDDDSVELFLDIDAAGGMYGGDDAIRTQLTFRYDDDTIYICGYPYDANKNAIDCSVIKHASAATEDGYEVEIYVPWAAFGRTDIGAGHLLSANAQLNDKDVNDPAAYEESALAYVIAGASNNSSSSGWPKFMLVAGEEADPVADVEALIDAIGEVTVDSAEAIEAARTAYDALTDEQKTQVENYEKLTAAEEAYAEAKLEKAKVDAIVELNKAADAADQSGYTNEQKNAHAAAVIGTKNAISAAENEEDVAKALADGLAAMEAVKDMEPSEPEQTDPTEPEETDPTEPSKPEDPTEPSEPEKLENPFVDITEDMFCYDSVLWAYHNDITTGKDATHFAPSIDCTRAQVVTFLWRAAGQPEPKSSENPFPDVAEGTYYTKAVLWAVEEGITNGFKDGTFGPKKTCTRGQIVTFLWRYAGEPEPKSAENPFPDLDVKSYCGEAVLWAVEEGITTGYKDGTFGPNKNCKRDQIVTFLYRYLAN